MLVSSRRKNPESVMAKLACDYSLLIQIHTEGVLQIAITEDEKYLVSASADKTIRIWNLIENRQISILTGHNSSVLAVAVSKDREFIASGSQDGTIILWNFQAKNIIGILKGHIKSIKHVAITNNTKYIVSGSRDGSIILWSIKELAQVAVFSHRNSALSGLAITSDSRFIVSASVNNYLLGWNIENHQQEFKMQSKAGYITSIAIVDGEYTMYTGCVDGIIAFWELKENSIEKIITKCGCAIVKLALTLDKQSILISTWDKSVTIFSLQHSTREIIFEMYYKMINFSYGHFCFELMKDERQFVVNNTDKGLLFYQLLSGGLKEIEFDGHSDIINCVIISKQNNYALSSSNDKTIRIWDLASKKQIGIFHCKVPVMRLVMTDNNKYIGSLSSDSRIKVYSMDENQIEKRTGISLELDSPNNRKYIDIAFSSHNGYLVSSEAKCYFRVWKFIRPKYK